MITSCKNQDKEQTDKSEEQTHKNLGAEKADIAMNYHFQCPMDCEDGKTYEEEGTCPVCKMNLEKIEKEHAEKDDDSHDHENSEGDENSVFHNWLVPST